MKHQPQIHMGIFIEPHWYTACNPKTRARSKLIVKTYEEWNVVTCKSCLLVKPKIKQCNEFPNK